MGLVENNISLCKAFRKLISTNWNPGSWVFQPQILESVQDSSNLNIHSEQWQKATFQGSTYISQLHFQRQNPSLAGIWDMPPATGIIMSCSKSGFDHVHSPALLPVFTTAGTVHTCVSPLLQLHIWYLNSKWLSAAPVCQYQRCTSGKGMEGARGG